MSDNSKDFGLFIDGLRLDRNMSREELIEGIVSLSQYKRYLRGATSIPNSILIALADRLKFSISGLHHIYDARQNKQLNKIIDVYSFIKTGNFDEAYSSALKIRDNIFVSDYNKLFYDFCLICIQYNLQMASEIHTLGKLSMLVNYPDCIKNESFNWVEINILMEIVRISSKIDNYEPSVHMYEIITSDNFNFITSEDNQFLPTVLSTLAPILGRQQKYKEVITLCNEGIEYCNKFQTSAALASLYLTKAYALKYLDRLDDAKECGKRALMQLYIEGNKDKFENYKSLLENRLELSEDDLKFI